MAAGSRCWRLIIMRSGSRGSALESGLLHRFARHNPLLGIKCIGLNRFAVGARGNVGATPSSCIFEEVRLRHHGGLLAAAVPYRKGASHDCSSATNDGGYAGTEFVAPYPGILSPTGFAVRTPLP